MTGLHKAQVDKLAKLVDYYGKPMYAIDVNRWGNPHSIQVRILSLLQNNVGLI